MVHAEKVVLAHELSTSAPSCVCSASRQREYDNCFTNSMYPGQVPVLKADEGSNTVVMVTGVDPVIGVDPVPGRKRKPRAIVFSKNDFCMIKRVPGTQLGDFFCNEK